MQKKHKKRQNKAVKVAVIVTAIVIGLVVLLDLTPFGGTIKYYSTWAKCGHIPVATRGSGYWNSAAPSYYVPPEVNIFPGNPPYFCTAFDAEKHGYSANPKEYDFPVLEANDALCKKPTDPESETAATFTPCK